MTSKRHQDILQFLETEGTATITALARHLDVSDETIRRDLKPLADSGAVIRLHGAVGLAGQLGEAPFQRRMRENAEAKRRIARHVAAMIADGDTLMLDTGTTTSFLARELMGHRRLTVVTNSSDIARTLATQNGNRVYMAGGELRSDSGAAFGAAAIDFIRRFRTRHAIISAGAIDETGVMDYDLAEAEFARAVLTCGERRLVVSDATKFHARGFIAVCGFEAFDELVTDRAPPGDLHSAILEGGATIAVAQA